jgi:hypothetical protein
MHACSCQQGDGTARIRLASTGRCAFGLQCSCFEAFEVRLLRASRCTEPTAHRISASPHHSLHQSMGTERKVSAE